MAQKGEVRWNLNDILPIDKFDGLYSEIAKEIETIDTWIERLRPKMRVDDFGKMLRFTEKFDDKLSRLSYLPHLMEAVDQKDSQARLLKTRTEDLALRAEKKLRKINHWIKGKGVRGLKRLGREQAKRLFKAIPDLEYGLWKTREAAKHSLKQREEEIISNKDRAGVGVLTDLRRMIETEFEYKMKIGGKIKKIKTQAELLAKTFSTKKEEREGAYRALLNKQKENLEKLFLVYQAVVKDWTYEADLRGFKSSIAVRNFGNDVPDRAVEALLKVCSEKRGVFLEYFEMKAAMLGERKLKRFDIYAPITLTRNENEWDYEKSKNVVLETLGDFSQNFREKAERIFKEEHIDSHPRPNKQAGAFCATVNPSIRPYLLLNHTGKIRDMFTMAHELGHGIHSIYAEEHFPSSQQAPLPLAETASTMAEMIVFERVYEQTKDRNKRRQLLADKLADSYATILRQNYFVLFEIQAHEAIKKGITAEDLSEIYFSTLEEQFGKTVEVDKLFRYEWAYVSHLTDSPFYCYAYNFGELLSYSLYARYKSEGQNFIPKLEKILAAGGSKKPEEILREVGVDMESEDFWRQSFKIIEEWLEKLK